MKQVININQMFQHSNEFEVYKGILQGHKDTLDGIRVKDWMIKKSLKKISGVMAEEIRQLQNMSQTLEYGCQLYQKCEENLAQMTCQPLEYDHEDGDSEGSKEHIWDYIEWKDLVKIIGALGGVGGGLAIGLNYWTVERNAKNDVGTLKYLASAIGKFAGAIEKTAGGAIDVSWQKWIGLNDAFEKIDPSSFGKAVKSSFAKELDDLDFSKTKDAAGNAKCAAKWAGYALTFLSNGIENWDEFKEGDISIERAAKETAIESVTDILLGMGATAVVSGAIAAAGITAGVPAIVIGGAGAAVVVGANAACKWVTGGRDIGEVVADAVCDADEMISNTVEKVQNVAKNVVSEKLGELGRGAVRIKSQFKSAFSAPWKSICGAFS